MNPPFVTVVVRSFRRIPEMLALVEAIRAQVYPDFEILVIEQTGPERAPYRSQLEEAQRDPRVRILEYPQLGPAGARNEALRQAKGGILLFEDDDDVPVGTGWIAAHAANYADPLCMAVTGREIWSLEEDPRPHESRKNYRLCLRYTWFKMPRGRVHHSRRLTGVTVVRGGNASLRRETIERAGGWDDEWYGEEHSLDFKFARVRRPGEYFVFDPTALHLRRFTVPGGTDRRQLSPEVALRGELSYSHRIVRRYFPWRFLLCYPAYLWLGYVRAYRLLRESRSAVSAVPRALRLLWAFPRTLYRVWRNALTRSQQPLGAGPSPTDS